MPTSILHYLFYIRFDDLPSILVRYHKYRSLFFVNTINWFLKIDSTSSVSYKLATISRYKVNLKQFLKIITKKIPTELKIILLAFFIR